jgi:hypothetical protein
MSRQQEYTMTQKEYKAMKAELARLNAFIAKHEVSKGSNEFSITENKAHTEKYGVRYVFVKIAKDSVELRKQLKAIRYGATGRGKARFDRNGALWSIQADALKGTIFGS